MIAQGFSIFPLGGEPAGLTLKKGSKMNKQDNIEFLKSRLRLLQEGYKTLQELLPCDLLPDDEPPKTSEDEERCARLADEYGFDGNLFRNLFPLDPDHDNVDFNLYLRRYRQQIGMIPRIIVAVESAKAVPPDKLSRHYSPAELANILRLSWDTIKKRLDSGQIRNVKHTTKDYQIHLDDLPSDKI